MFRFLFAVSLLFVSGSSYAECDSCEIEQPEECICYCPVTKYRDKVVCERRCVEEPYTIRKRKVRYIEKTIEKQRCRYIPEYYTETCTVKVPDYYYEDVTCMRKKWITEKKCIQESYTCYEKRSCSPPPTPDCE